MDYNKVINLGQVPNVPLMCLSSELSDRSEPHDHIYSSGQHGTAADVAPAGSRGVPGGDAAGWVPGGWYTGYWPEAGFEAYLMNIRVKLVHTAV